MAGARFRGIDRRNVRGETHEGGGVQKGTTVLRVCKHQQDSMLTPLTMRQMSCRNSNGIKNFLEDTLGNVLYVFARAFSPRRADRGLSMVGQSPKRFRFGL